MGFVHLHLHTQFSLLDGAIRLTDLFPHAKEMGLSHVAMTDHGNMYGAIKFYEGAHAHGLKPIIGCEVYVAPEHRTVREKRRPPYHLVLLAKNNEGYANLSRLVSLGFIEGFYTKPRIDKEILAKYSKGLIGLTACLSGEVAKLISNNKVEEAYKTALEYQSLFEKDSFYLELQKNGLVEQDLVNAELLNISELSGIPVVATNDCHYLRRVDHQAHEVLMCIQTGKKLEDTNRMRLSTDQFYVKSPDEMYEQFQGLEHALENTDIIARQCDVSIEMGKFKLPRYPAPKGETTDEYLERMSGEKLAEYLKKERDAGLQPDEEVYMERLKFELGVIQKMGFSDYYLIVWDFINYARANGIPVGPGRGSGAGSLVAYSVGITAVDPIKFDLLFERFLNPDRVDMPDFDIDFCKRKREQVIEYVTKFYGKERVSQIATYSSLNPKQAVRDVGRVLGFTFAETDRISKLFPDGPQAAEISIAELLQSDRKIREIRDTDDRHKQLFTVASSLEKLNRQAGIHAAGVVIAKDPLIDTAPLWTGKNGEVVSQFAKEELEKIGLVKFDFLGLKTLTVLDECLVLIKRNGKEPPVLDELPLDRPEVYELISEGSTHGVFQMESEGFRKLVRSLGPDRFEDIIAVLALYRPGPLSGGMVDSYVNRKRGRERIDYGHELLEPILKDTYGVIVYQEQVMRIASVIGGFSMSEADELRKAMAKKKKDKMAKLRKKFVAGGVKRKHPKSFVLGLMDTLEKFGQYGFNKSHSAAYAFISYWTAYLKANFPVEFMAALTSLDKNDPEKMVGNLAECRRMRIVVKVPDINKSDMDFSVSGATVLFGLSGIKNVGESAVKSVLEERDAGGPFKDFYGFLLRIDGSRVNKRVIEGLVNAGAFDCLGRARMQLLSELDHSLALAQKEARDKAVGQKSLFAAKPGGRKGRKKKQSKTDHLDITNFLDRRTLHAEKDAIGFYLSGHPLDSFLGIIGELTSHTLSDVDRGSDGESVTIAGVVRSVNERKLKRGNKLMAKIELEDRYGMVNLVAFSEAYEPARELLRCQDPLLVRGTLQVDQMGDGEDARRSVEVIAESIVPFSEEAQKLTKGIEVKLPADERCESSLQALERVVTQYSGEIPLLLNLQIEGKGGVRIRPAKGTGIQLHEDALFAITSLVGKKGVRFFVDRSQQR
jgi:DNA polymerase III subunit alpha